jgi:hypothetical protein
MNIKRKSKNAQAMQSISDDRSEFGIGGKPENKE